MRKADDCGQPGRCMMHSRPTLSGKCLSPALLQRPPAAAEFTLPDDLPLLFNHPTSHVPETPVPHAFGDYGFQHSWRQCPVRPWSSLAMPRCQRSSWPLFGARAEERVRQQKSVTKTQKTESLRKQDGTNLKDSRSKTS